MFMGGNSEHGLSGGQGERRNEHGLPEEGFRADLSSGSPEPAPSPKAGAHQDFALTEQQVERWAAASKPRDQVVYFRGPRLVRTPGVEAMTRLHDDGEVILNWRRSSPGIGEWLATRRAEPERPKPLLPSFLRSTPVSDTRDDKERTLAVLKRHANLQRPCPSNREIGAQAGLKSADRAAYLIRLLIGDREIRVETDAQTGFRVVTILSSGRKTAAATTRDRR